MIKSISILLALIVCAASYGQQRPLYSFFDDNITAINPSLPRTEFIFDDYSFFINATHRNQWIGFDNAPKTFLVQASTWLPDWSNYKSLGTTHAGIDIIHDETAPFYFSGIYGRLGHLVYLNKGRRYRSSKTFIAAGLNVGLNWHRIKREDLGELITDPSLEGLVGTSFLPDLGFGVSFNHYITKTGRDVADSQGFFLGFSVPQTMQFNATHETATGKLEVERIRHYNFVAGGQLGADAENFKVRPMALVRYIPSAPLYISGNVELTLQEYLFIGFGANSNFSISTRIGFNVPMNGPKKSNGDAIRLGFGYSKVLSAHNAGSTLEFTATYMVNFQEY